MSGGTQAAYGYRYQYLVTAEFFLRYLRDHLSELASTVLHVEPPTLAARGAAAVWLAKRSKSLTECNPDPTCMVVKAAMTLAEPTASRVMHQGRIRPAYPPRP
jgi:hypothetical protein